MLTNWYIFIAFCHKCTPSSNSVHSALCCFYSFHDILMKTDENLSEMQLTSSFDSCTTLKFHQVNLLPEKNMFALYALLVLDYHINIFKCRVQILLCLLYKRAHLHFYNRIMQKRTVVVICYLCVFLTNLQS